MAGTGMEPAADGRLTGDTQSAYLLALDFGLLRDERKDAAARRLVELIAQADGHLQTGFLGVRHLCPVLTGIGRDDLAVDLLLKDTYPSWGFSIAHGATTIWERWDGWTPDRGFQSANMNSFNHYAYGAVGEWIWSRVVGIDAMAEAPGYASICMAPLFDRRLAPVSARYRGTRGEVSSDWDFAGDDVVWTVTVPPNCTAAVTLPPGWRCAGQSGNSFVLGSGRRTLRLAKD